MELTLLERFAILSVLPARGSIRTLRVIANLQGVLAPTEDEIKELQIVDDDAGGVRFNRVKETERGPGEFAVGEVACEVIADALKKADERQALTVAHLPVYERFVERKEGQQE